jgi:hypothetical protein
MQAKVIADNFVAQNGKKILKLPGNGKRIQGI